MNNSLELQQRLKALKREINTYKQEADKNRELLETLQEERKIFLKSNVVVFKWSLKEGWPILYVSENVKDLLAYTADELMKPGKWYTEIIDKGMVKQVVKEVTHYVYETLVSETDLTDYIVIRKDGTKAWVHDRTVIARNNKGAPIHCWGFVRNINDRKKAELAQQQSEMKYRTLFEENRDAILITQKDGKIIDVNQAGSALFGYRREDIVGMNISRLYAYPDDRKVVLREITSEGFLRNYEVMFQRKDGQKIVCETTTNVWHAEDGSILGYQGIIRDVSERKQMEEALRESREGLRNLSQHLETVREEERTHMAREIHDELGQVLTSLKMRISWVGKRLRKDQQPLVKRIESISKLVELTIGTVQKISKALRPGLLDELGLATAIEREAKEFRQWSGIQCHVIVDPEEITLAPALSTTLFRIFQETLTNAARHAKATKVEVSLKENAGKVMLEVKDNGKGITEKEKSGQQSLGLIGMKERAHFFGGEVCMSGQPGKGSTVTVSIPIKRTGEKQ